MPLTEFNTTFAADPNMEPEIPAGFYTVKDGIAAPNFAADNLTEQLDGGLGISHRFAGSWLLGGGGVTEPRPVTG